jgi:hypothetical protein
MSFTSVSRCGALGIRSEDYNGSLHFAWISYHARNSRSYPHHPCLQLESDNFLVIASPAAAVVPPAVLSSIPATSPLLSSSAVTVQVVCSAPSSSTGQIALTHTSASGCPVTSDLVQLVVNAPPAAITVLASDTSCHTELGAMMVQAVFNLPGGLRAGDGLSYQADAFNCIIDNDGGK